MPPIALQALQLSPYDVDAMYNHATHLAGGGGAGVTQQDGAATKQYRTLLRMETRIRNFEGIVNIQLRGGANYPHAREVRQRLLTVPD